MASFPFMRLPRELRDQVYDHALASPSHYGDLAIRLEGDDNVLRFRPSAAAILRLLRYDSLLISQQVCDEALKVLFQCHTVFLGGAPLDVLRLLKRTEQHEQGKRWLGWLRAIELDWKRLPKLRDYDAPRVALIMRRDWEEQNRQKAEPDGVFGDDCRTYPSVLDWQRARSSPSSLASQDPDSESESDSDAESRLAQCVPYRTDSGDWAEAKLHCIVREEVVPLFVHLAARTYALTSLTLPLYFYTRKPRRGRRVLPLTTYRLPEEGLFWVRACAHALLMLNLAARTAADGGPGTEPRPCLGRVCVRYKPRDIWASAEPKDDLRRIVERGVWFRPSEDPLNEREGEGDSFRALWAVLEEMEQVKGEGRLGLKAKVELVPWGGDMSETPGDGLLVEFEKKGKRKDQGGDQGKGKGKEKGRGKGKEKGRGKGKEKGKGKGKEKGKGKGKEKGKWAV